MHDVGGPHLGIFCVAPVEGPNLCVLSFKASLRCHIHMLVSFILQIFYFMGKRPRLPLFTLIHLFTISSCSVVVRGFFTVFPVTFDL